MTDAAGNELRVLEELGPTVEANLDRHLKLAQEWMPHEYVPWGQGRDFDEVPWEPGQSTLSELAQVAFEVNLLTEDNLPSYHLEISNAKVGGPWWTWVHRWTAEEGRHAAAMRDYLLVTRGVDPIGLERGRMHQMQVGFTSRASSPIAGLAYVSFQELATRISHRNTGRYTEDPVAERLLARIAADENLHMIFYRNLITAALEIDPSRTVRAIADEVKVFQMPGTGIRDFIIKALYIANAGIYDLRIHHDDVVMPLLRHWRYFDVTGLDGEAEKARDDLAAFLANLDQQATRFTERRAQNAAKASV